MAHDAFTDSSRMKRAPWEGHGVQWCCRSMSFRDIMVVVVLVVMVVPYYPDAKLSDLLEIRGSCF